MSGPKSELPPVPSDAVLLSVREVASMLGRSENAVWTMLADHQLTRIKAGRSTKIVRLEVEQWVLQQRTRATIVAIQDAAS